MKSLSVDQVLFLFFNKNHSPLFDWLMSFASSAFSWTPIYLVCIFILLRVLRSQNLSDFIGKASLLVICIFAIVFVCSGWLPNLFSYFIARQRPCYDSDLSSVIHTVGDVCKHRYGFYTFRTCTMFALSVFLCLAFDELKGWVRALLLFWAVFVSYSRIYLGAHYPINVFVSALSGVLLGYLGYRFYYYVKESVLVI